ncbi:MULTISPECIES: glycoside hydrolase family 43 protein [Paenibacillus]|uniref:glycoside hydrolase family 43 protein n=1 Tax=Paenibacillus TaxID=44249 RepID=UPI000491166E|nr:family 43 glycosylhydrolase [Paenibacillus sp. IHBB 10380]
MSELKLNNPLIEQRADPWIYKHTDGYYYFTASVPEYDRIELRRSRTIAGLAETEGTTIWVKHETGWMSANIWAPEIHYIDGKWYVYYAAAHTSETRDGLFDHRMFVLENEAANPLEGEWVEKGQVVTKWESFALDATTFEHRGTRYYVWAQKDPGIPGNSNLYISEMENPWTLKGDQVLISRPEYEWEKQGYLVNEGAAILKRNGRIFMTYSASATDHNYCMGLLTADESSDLLNPTSWVKSPEPVFATSEANGQYGPGHNSFTVSEDGTQDILVYHARSYKEIEGDPLYDPNRHTRVQLIRWNEDGTPNFGVPRPDTKLVNAD